MDTELDREAVEEIYKRVIDFRTNCFEHEGGGGDSSDPETAIVRRAGAPTEHLSA